MKCRVIYFWSIPLCSSAISAFFPIYYVAEDGLQGTVGNFSLIVSLST